MIVGSMDCEKTRNDYFRNNPTKTIKQFKNMQKSSAKKQYRNTKSNWRVNRQLSMQGIAVDYFKN